MEMDTNPLPWGKPWPKALAPPLQSQGFEMLLGMLLAGGMGMLSGVLQQPNSPRGHPTSSAATLSLPTHLRGGQGHCTSPKDILGFWDSPNAGNSAKTRTRG